MYDTYNECLTKLTSSFSLAKAPIRVVPRSTPFPLHARGGLVAAIRNLFRELEIAPTPEILRPVCAKIHSILNPGFHEEATKKRLSYSYFPLFYSLFNRDLFWGNGFTIKSHITRCFFSSLLTWGPSDVSLSTLRSCHWAIKIWLFNWEGVLLAKNKTPFKTKMKFVFIFILLLSFSAETKLQPSITSSPPVSKCRNRRFHHCPSKFRRDSHFCGDSM